MSNSFSAKLSSEFLPYLYPNQYVNFNKNSEAVKTAEELAKGQDNDLAVLQMIYDYVTGHIIYDHEKAKNVPTGYLPVVDETLKSGKGICFDYAALMTAMLRSRGIPTRLEIGYTQAGVYHAWISAYLQDSGWVDNIIRFDGKSWSLMDPTMTAAVDTASEKEKIVKESGDYIIKYIR
ncbi:MAG: transglutaminase-like domain-containing protein [Eubacteriales bacterium]|nr:transglutaminase-like domain-containing protein [Eubacteriales bacterium]